MKVVDIQAAKDKMPRKERSYICPNCNYRMDEVEYKYIIIRDCPRCSNSLNEFYPILEITSQEEKA